MNKQTKPQQLLFLFLTILCLFFGMFYSYTLVNGWTQLWMKGVASAIFVCSGILSYRFGKTGKCFCTLMLIGLFLGFLGDIVIPLKPAWCFAAGVGIFALGHIFYAIAFAYANGIHKLQILVFALLSALLVAYILLNPKLEPGGMFGVLVVYILVISFMAGGALDLLSRREENRWASQSCAIGAVLFLISDFLLLNKIFLVDGPKAFLCYANLATYYPAQILLGLSLLDGFEKKK